MVMMIVAVIMFVLVFGVVWDIVVMEAEKAFDEEHREHAGEERDCYPANSDGAGSHSLWDYLRAGWKMDH